MYKESSPLNSQGKACDLTTCSNDHIDLSITSWTNGDGVTTEAFCISHWTPKQFEALRNFVTDQNNGASCLAGRL